MKQSGSIKFLQGDITRVQADAIVNAANAALIPGGGVDGAIHRAAGPEFSKAVARLREEKGGCPTGTALLAPGGRLPAKYVILTAGPVWHGGSRNEAKLLADCYRNSILLADQKGLKSIAFPAISTGVYGYPVEEAAAVAVRTAQSTLQETKSLKEVLFVLFDKNTYETFLKQRPAE